MLSLQKNENSFQDLTKNINRIPISIKIGPRIRGRIGKPLFLTPGIVIHSQRGNFVTTHNFLNWLNYTGEKTK